MNYRAGGKVGGGDRERRRKKGRSKCVWDGVLMWRFSLNKLKLMEGYLSEIEEKSDK